MPINGRTMFILALLAFWIYLAYRAFGRGNTVLALSYLAIGGALTIYRFRRTSTA